MFSHLNYWTILILNFASLLILSRADANIEKLKEKNLKFLQGIEENFKSNKSKHVQSHYFNIKYCNEKKFVWFRVFKVASGTIWEVLDREIPTLKATRPKKVPVEFKNHFKFAFVRNPWDRVVSCYFHKIVTKKSKEFKECFGKDFEFFVKYISKIDLKTANPHIKLQTRLIPVDQCDFIGKMENFNEDFKYICDLLGIEMGDLVHKHQTNHIHYSSYYTPSLKKIIAKLYQEDIEAFNYTFESK